MFFVTTVLSGFIKSELLTLLRSYKILQSAKRKQNA